MRVLFCAVFKMSGPSIRSNVVETCTDKANTKNKQPATIFIQCVSPIFSIYMLQSFLDPEIQVYLNMFILNTDNFSLHKHRFHSEKI